MEKKAKKEKKPKKRGRKPKNKKAENGQVKKKKKRGRKPKGGKIINKLPEIQSENTIVEPNIILHLKCKTKDLLSCRKNFFTNKSNDYIPEISQIESFEMNKNTLSKQTFLNVYEIEQNSSPSQNKHCDEFVIISNHKKDSKKSDISAKKEINDKLKELSIQLHKDEVSGKKSDCFWCTYYFDNPPIYIPARQRDYNIEAYGCFCSPQCAVAYLGKENIDSTTYWERYALLNNIYGKIFKQSNIKPAPDPFYILDKFYGNLTIQEYRQILDNSQILMVIDKPLTKIFPELHEGNFETPPIFTSMHDKKDKSVSNKLRLKRNIPCTSKKSVLTKTFNFS